MLPHAYNIITDRGVGALVPEKEIVDGFNDTKNVFSVLITTVKLPGAASYG